ncbi:MAG: murein L,D-transpeptidase catalytic domain family protein [Deltaproteobacteria bacterium]|jgi:hypothetical protein
MDNIRTMCHHFKILSIAVTLLTLGMLSTVGPIKFPVQTCQAYDVYIEDPVEVFEEHLRFLYKTIGLKNNGLSFDVFRYALIGYYNLKGNGAIKKRGIISIIDYRKSSKDERFYVIDLINKKVLYHTLVAHGRNSGELYARHFSNEPGSLKSSLGFFVTGNTYEGEHGYSLYLYGKERGINDKARERRIIVHGAYYARSSFIKRYGRLGRSQGCPALPAGPHINIIDTIVGGTCLFQFYNDSRYLQRSTLLNVGTAAAQLAEEYSPFIQIKVPDR